MKTSGFGPPFRVRNRAPTRDPDARAETLASGALFGGPWKRGQRCIIPALGFYEWHVNAVGIKQPFYIHLDDQTIFGFAGLWEDESCTIITLPANALMAGMDPLDTAAD
jgi:putative SOS response-associated peptidase YedK